MTSSQYEVLSLFSSLLLHVVNFVSGKRTVCQRIKAFSTGIQYRGNFSTNSAIILISLTKMFCEVGSLRGYIINSSFFVTVDPVTGI